jgi:hypothetical protein
MNKGCNCIGWQTNIKKLDGIETLANVHGFAYDGEQFKFCPWCGLALNRPHCDGKTHVIDTRNGSGRCIDCGHAVF